MNDILPSQDLLAERKVERRILDGAQRRLRVEKTVVPLLNTSQILDELLVYGWQHSRRISSVDLVGIGGYGQPNYPLFLTGTFYF